MEGHALLLHKASHGSRCPSGIRPALSKNSLGCAGQLTFRVCNIRATGWSSQTVQRGTGPAQPAAFHLGCSSPEQGGQGSSIHRPGSLQGGHWGGGPVTTHYPRLAGQALSEWGEKGRGGMSWQAWEPLPCPQLLPGPLTSFFVGGCSWWTRWSKGKHRGLVIAFTGRLNLTKIPERGN